MTTQSNRCHGALYPAGKCKDAKIAILRGYVRWRTDHDSLWAYNQLRCVKRCALSGGFTIDSILFERYMLKSAIGQSKVFEVADRSTSDVPLLHWNCLFDAVIARLTEAVAAPFEPAQCERGLDATANVQITVLECVEAFQQLHAELTIAINRCQASERELLALKTALARARAERLYAQDGVQRAQNFALHDALTPLPNKSHFRWHVDQALAKRSYDLQPLALLIMDVDGVKPISEAHGHETGNELLKAIASRLTRSVRSEDIVGRIGWGEFACLLENSPDRESLNRLALTLVNTISAPLTIGGNMIAVRPSIGIAMCPADGATSDQLLKNADDAMHRAKRWKSGFAFCDLIGV